MTVLVLMKAMPPTIGHRRLLEWAYSIGDVEVIMDMASDEPMRRERILAVEEMVDQICSSGMYLSIHDIEVQDPDDPEFWEIWDKILGEYDMIDYVVASEPYGQIVADKVGAIFMPYDPNRELCDVKATDIRNDPVINFKNIDPTFQPHLRTTVTVFGAESTGKTTFSKDLQWNWPSSRWVFEWARPYLEMVGPEITVQKMKNIWIGQRALQMQARHWPDKPLLIQDTDLFSTLGYWEQPHWARVLGPPPRQLWADAMNLKSDLYLITKSNIPFEKDEIRYGGDKRESPDEFWIGIAEKYGLNYKVIESNDRKERIEEVAGSIGKIQQEKMAKIAYDRKGL